MGSRNLDYGRSSEALAERHLAGLGYRLLERSARSRLGEVDLVMADGPTVVFVEVKARSSGRFGLPAEAVTSLKRRRIAKVAASYLAAKGWGNVPARFDVVSISGAEVLHIPGAFEAPAGRL